MVITNSQLYVSCVSSVWTSYTYIHVCTVCMGVRTVYVLHTRTCCMYILGLYALCVFCMLTCVYVLYMLYTFSSILLAWQYESVLQEEERLGRGQERREIRRQERFSEGSKEGSVQGRTRETTISYNRGQTRRKWVSDMCMCSILLVSVYNSLTLHMCMYHNPTLPVYCNPGPTPCVL